MLGELALLKKRALRKGVWFRTLSRIERSIYDLTMKTVSTIRSKRLLRIIKAIVDKLRESLESPVGILTCTIGRQLALTLAQVALSWGHLKAREWPLDGQFARYLAICWHMNLPEYFRAKPDQGTVKYMG